MNLTNKQIAKDLRSIANDYPDNSDKEMEEVYKNNTFKIRCIPSKIAILKVAKKYDKTLRLTSISPTRKPTMGKVSFQKILFKEMVIAGEYENAVNYGVLFNMSIYFTRLTENDYSSIIIDAEEFEPGFVVGRLYIKNQMQNWNVIHLESGMTCNSKSHSKKESITKFKSISKEDIKKKVFKWISKGNYQHESLLHYGFI